MFAGYQLDDGHGDYNRSYERNWDIDYADYSTDHRENNYRNYEWKVPKSKKRAGTEHIEPLRMKKGLPMRQPLLSIPTAQ